MYQLVESYDDKATISIDRRTFPATALVEDQDGMRLLIVPEMSFKAHVFARAASNGAAAIILYEEAVGYWLALATEDFLAARQENATTGMYDATKGMWVSLGTGPPEYREIIIARRARLDLLASPGPISKGFVHLHVHTEYSAVDGLSRPEEVVQAAVDDGQEAVGVTDHAVCAAHPDFFKACVAAGITPVLGIEANFTDNRHRRGDEEAKDGKFVLGDYRHLIMWAKNDIGLRNIWAASTEANLTGFYGRPRLDWDVLERFNDHVMASTACLRGPLSQRILAEDEEGARAQLARLLRIFDNRLWIELHTNQMEEQKRVNVELVRMAQEFGLPTIAVCDSHYACADDKDTHQVWIAGHTGKSLTDDADLFAGGYDYHLMTEVEVRKSLAYLPDDVVEHSIEQTRVIASQCTAGIRVGRTMPVYSRKGGPKADKEKAVDLCMQAWPRKVENRGVARGHGTEDEYIARFMREAKLLTDKGYWGYYLTVWEQTDFAKSNNVLVGPGRGSGSGSLIAYLLGITEIDPIEAGLMFERFLTEGRDSPPDFDVDYPSSKRDLMQDHTVDRWGYEYVLRVGTHGRLRNKGAIKEVAGALKDTYDINWLDIEACSKIIEAAEADTAGKGMSWDELWEIHGDIPLDKDHPFTLNDARKKYPELFHYADRVVGRLKSYGRHAAGMVISTGESLVGQLPLRTTEKSDQVISEFDMKALELMGLLKFDILTLRTLDTLQMTLDLIYEHYGKRIDVLEWDDEYNDPMVWDNLCEGKTLGVFQIETPGSTRLTKRFGPHSIADLADIITLIRPGPARSGLTEMYLRRKNGEEAVSYLDPRLEEILRPTYGTFPYQEQVMSICQVMAGYSLAEADEIRRIMGKKETEKVQAAGVEFCNRCVERGMDRGAAEVLWGQLGEFAKYGFNKSHAWAYALIGYWCAWFKFHYPAMFLTAILSTIDQGRVPEFVYEARRLGYKVLPPDVNRSGQSFKPDGGIAVRYGLEAIKGVGESAVDKIIATQPFTSYEDFRERSGVDVGKVRILVQVGAFDSLVPNRRSLEQQLEWKTSGDDKWCVHKDLSAVGPGGLPCTFDWSSEPVEIGRRGVPKKPKDPPKKCTVRCRNYQAPEAPDFDAAPEYTEVEVREKERELLGINLSSTPHDRIPDSLREELRTYDEVISGENPKGAVAAVIMTVRQRQDRNGKQYGFLTLDLGDGTVDVVCFSQLWREHSRTFVRDRLCLVLIEKNDRGHSLIYYKPL